jgi:hypothetical protein
MGGVLINGDVLISGVSLLKDSTIDISLILYSGKFLHGAKFHVFHRKVGCRENMNHEIADRLMWV